MSKHLLRLVAFRVKDIRAAQQVPPHLQCLEITDTGRLPRWDWPSRINVQNICEAGMQKHLGLECAYRILDVHGAPSRGLTLDVMVLLTEDAYGDAPRREYSWMDASRGGISQKDCFSLIAGEEMLKKNLEHGDGRLAFELVDRTEFTASELRRVYEAVLNMTLDRSNFRKKVDRMIDAGTVLEIRGRMRPTLTRPASLYHYIG